jgi:hypothetical protein
VPLRDAVSQFASMDTGSADPGYVSKIDIFGRIQSSRPVSKTLASNPAKMWTIENV